MIANYQRFLCYPKVSFCKLLSVVPKTGNRPFLMKVPGEFAYKRE